MESKFVRIEDFIEVIIFIINPNPIIIFKKQ